MEDENEKRENLIIRLNELGEESLLSLFNDFLNGALDNNMNGIIGEWADEELEEFVDFAESKVQAKR